eukprot:6465517-Amphidinium_carterae.1
MLELNRVIHWDLQSTWVDRALSSSGRWGMARSTSWTGDSDAFTSEEETSPVLAEPHFARVGPPQIDEPPPQLISSDEEGQGDEAVLTCGNVEVVAGTWKEHLAGTTPQYQQAVPMAGMQGASLGSASFIWQPRPSGVKRRTSSSSRFELANSGQNCASSSLF